MGHQKGAVDHAGLILFSPGLPPVRVCPALPTLRFHAVTRCPRGKEARPAEGVLSRAPCFPGPNVPHAGMASVAIASHESTREKA